MNRQRQQHCIYLRSKTLKWLPLAGPFRFLFPKILTCKMFFLFRPVGGIRRVQIPRDICTRFERNLVPRAISAFKMAGPGNEVGFGRYLYSTRLSWIIIPVIVLKS